MYVPYVRRFATSICVMLLFLAWGDQGEEGCSWSLVIRSLCWGNVAASNNGSIPPVSPPSIHTNTRTHACFLLHHIIFQVVSAEGDKTLADEL
jgi:hypothetical protein